MDIPYQELGEFLGKLGGWGVAGVCILGIKKLYEDNKSASTAHAAEIKLMTERHNAEKTLLFEKTLEMSSSMAGVLATNTETARNLALQLQDLRDGADSTTGPRQLPPAT